ncbi:MAG: TMEM165/GDT1 family protein [Ectothiorhodospiraceae bacterium]|nr:TMEM165/GDT1 family protein [Ectothiorhodospiraceae bacterium]MCH8505217.1 TMEM165/GDT1 family protein [Ectothiorhodospiraceae bacterium]
MELFFLSTLAVGIAEIGDRSLFLAILFGVIYQRPWPVFWGMATGLFANQALSALVGVWLFSFISAQWHAWLVGVVFLVMAVWVLVPEADEPNEGRPARSIFFAAAVSFFLLEMADKTQLAVVALAGGTGSIVPVVLGATLGILLVTTPALVLGHRFAAHLPIQALRVVASLLFGLLGAWTLAGAMGWLPESAVFDPAQYLEWLNR